MFKLLLVVAVAAAADTEAPVISLELVGAGVKDSPAHQSGSSYADECCDGVDCQSGPCQLPKAWAYDHHDGVITKRIEREVSVFAFSAPGKKPASDNRVLSDAEFNDALLPNAFRGEFVLRYDVKDTSGNAAETITFALIMRDTIAPSYDGANRVQEMPLGTHESHFKAIPLSDFSDSYDRQFVKVEFTHGQDVITLESSATKPCGTQCEYAVPAKTNMNGYLCASTTAKAKMSDFANIFGDSNQNNFDTVTFEYNVVDTQPPSIALPSPPSAAISTTECTGKYNSGASDVYPYAAGSVSSTDLSCNCLGSQNLVETVGAVNQCQYSCNSVYNEEAIPATKQDGTVVVTCQALDFDNQKTVKSTSSIVITDTTPPEIILNPEDHYKHSVHATDFKSNQTYFYNVTSQSTTSHGFFTVQHSAGYLKDAPALKSLADDWTCSDTCHDDVTKKATWYKTNGESADGAGGLCGLTNSWPAVTMDDVQMVATYVLKYTCSDEVGNSAEACRTVYNEDHNLPVLNIAHEDNDRGPCAGAGVGCTGIAAGQGNYHDEGAQCSDQNDGLISQVVVAHGDIVDTETIGTYHVTYECQDSWGNVAIPATRTVIVYDETCPTCQVSNYDVTVEASFPYADAAVSCTDNRVFANGSKKVSATTTGFVNVEKTGKYVLTYHATDAEGNTNFDCSASCDPASDDKCYTNGPFAPLIQTRTVTVDDTLKPVLILNENGVKLMEERPSSVSGWLLSAIASAVAGVALVGYATHRSSAVDTSVPV